MNRQLRYRGSAAEVATIARQAQGPVVALPFPDAGGVRDQYAQLVGGQLAGGRGEISEERLAVACRRVQERLAGAPANLDHVIAQLAARVAKAKPYLRWITASRGANVRMITIEEVCYFQADTKYTLVALPDGDSLIHIPIRDLLEQLDPQMFWQIHRSTIVNVQEIDTIGRDAADHVIVRMKRRTETLRVSQQFAYRFRQM